MTDSKMPLGRSASFSRRPLQLAFLSLATLIAMTMLTSLSAWQLLDLRVFDYLSTFSHPPRPEKGPVIVAIDEPSLADINMQWPWPRSLHARLIEQLRQAGARIIGFDIIFSEPSTVENDAALANVLGPDVVLAADETLIPTPQSDQLVLTAPLAQFTEKGVKSGVASIRLGRDGIFRELPYYEDSFANQLGKAAGFSWDTPPEGNLVQTFGPARTYPTVSYYQALDPQNMLPPGFFKDRVVLVGLSLQNAPSVDSRAGDAFPTSYTVHTGKLVAGVEIQATILDNLRDNLSITYPGLPVRLTVLLAIGLLASAASWRQLSWSSGVLAAMCMVLLPSLSLLWLKLGRTYISPLGPCVAYLMIAVGQAAFDYADERKNRKQIIRAFSQYLSPALVQRLAHDPSQLRLGGERRTLSILFCDVRGFTTIAEALQNDPEQLTTLINRLLTPLSDVVLKHNGTIDKYIGDCLMAFWNAPLDDEHHALHAVTTAFEMLDAVKTLNVELAHEAAARGAVPYRLRIGIGINSGECVVGNMGSARRFDYSALGDSVNLASRLEGASKNYATSFLIGEQTARAVEAHLPVVELDRIQVKGRSEFSPIYTVLKQMTEDERQAHQVFLAAKYAGTILPAVEGQAAPDLLAYYDLMRSYQQM